MAAARAAALASRCQGARTPALAGFHDFPLTRRQHQTARLAAEGLSSREISRHLALSVRTVDNHLGAAYRRLGVASRRELRAILGLETTPGLEPSHPDMRVPTPR